MLLEEVTGSPGALLTFSNVSIVIQDSLLQQLSTDLDAVLAFHNSSVSLVRSSFINNIANVSSGIMAHNTSRLSMEDCHFINNTGMPGGTIPILHNTGFRPHISAIASSMLSVTTRDLHETIMHDRLEVLPRMHCQQDIVAAIAL